MHLLAGLHLVAAVAPSTQGAESGEHVVLVVAWEVAAVPTQKVTDALGPTLPTILKEIPR